jgi:hypothetical protein
LGSILEDAERLSLQFISNALSNALSESRVTGGFRQIIGAIAFVKEPFTPHHLEELLSLERGEVTLVLSKLRSVTAVPITDDDPIEPLPQSLLGYLMDSNMCQNPDLIMDPRTQHMHLALACLDHIGQQMQQYLQSQSTTINHNSVITEQQAIPHNLQYACLHWVSHLTQSSCEPTLVAAMDNFFSQHVLFWLDIMSRLKLVRRSHDCLQLTRKWLSVSMVLVQYSL